MTFFWIWSKIILKVRWVQIFSDRLKLIPEQLHVCSLVCANTQISSNTSLNVQIIMTTFLQQDDYSTLREPDSWRYLVLIRVISCEVSTLCKLLEHFSCWLESHTSGLVRRGECDPNHSSRKCTFVVLVVPELCFLFLTHRKYDNNTCHNNKYHNKLWYIMRTCAFRRRSLPGCSPVWAGASVWLWPPRCQWWLLAVPAG